MGSKRWTPPDSLSGTLYPLLARLHEDGLLDARQEDVDPKEVGGDPGGPTIASRAPVSAWLSRRSSRLRSRLATSGGRRDGLAGQRPRRHHRHHRSRRRDQRRQQRSRHRGVRLGASPSGACLEEARAFYGLAAEAEAARAEATAGNRTSLSVLGLGLGTLPHPRSTRTAQRAKAVRKIREDGRGVLTARTKRGRRQQAALWSNSHPQNAWRIVRVRVGRRGSTSWTRSRSSAPGSSPS